jgi:hypothetical protein
MKCFYNARNTIPYIQDIEITNAFRDGVSNINIIEEIAMKKPKTVVDLLAFALRPQRLELGSFNLITRGPQRRSSRKIRRSTVTLTFCESKFSRSSSALGCISK